MNDHPYVQQWINHWYKPDDDGFSWIPKECMIEQASGALIYMPEPPPDVAVYLIGPERRENIDLPIYRSSSTASCTSGSVDKT